MEAPRATYVYYFCDESSYVDGRFMAVAGLAVPDYDLAPITQDLLAIKEAMHGPSEVKWSTAKSRRDNVHAAFIDYFCDALTAKRIHFHIRFAPFNECDHHASGRRHRIDTTSKMHYQLLLHRALKFYGRHYRLRIRPDNGDCTEALKRQIDNLHFNGSSSYQTGHDCIESIEPRDSKREVFLQLLDVPLGAFTALRNDRPLRGPKRALADYVRAKFPHLDLAGNSPQTVKGFSVWNVVPSGLPKRGPWG